jgi:predicted RNase H-like HicB family nuclease
LQDYIVLKSATMNKETQVVLDLGLGLSPAERISLARELMRSAAAENPAFAGEVGEAASVYGWAAEPASPWLGSASQAPERVAFTLEYWPDEGFVVGRLREVPGVFSQGESLAELEENIRDAYALVISDHLQSSPAEPGARRKRIEVEA